MLYPCLTILTTYFLSEYKRNEVTFVDTGESAEELFSGCESYFIGINLLKFVPKSIEHLLNLFYYYPLEKRDRQKLINFSLIKDKALKNYFTNLINKKRF